MSNHDVRRVGIMGGTFDPIHNAHIALGEWALRELSLDEVWFMPAGDPYFKKKKNVTPGEVRCEMTRIALRGKHRMVMSEFEQQRQGETYTADTVELLQKCYPEISFYFILGSDSLYQIEQWYQPERIMKTVTLVVAERDYPERPRSLREQAKYLQEKFHAEVMILHFPEMEISSTEIRQRVKNGQDIDAYVPKEVYRYIYEHGLYKDIAKA